MRVRKPQPSAGHFVEVWRTHSGRAVAAKVAVADVIGIDEDYIRLAFETTAKLSRLPKRPPRLLPFLRTLVFSYLPLLKVVDLLFASARARLQ